MVFVVLLYQAQTLRLNVQPIRINITPLQALKSLPVQVQGSTPKGQHQLRRQHGQ